jgi:hypothetical protein
MVYLLLLLAHLELPTLEEVVVEVETMVLVAVMVVPAVLA